MKKYKYIVLSLALLSTILFTKCSDDESSGPIINETCSDGIQNNGETAVDCGGPNCTPCTETFSGIYVQQDIMGRPGINTVFGGNGERKNRFNNTLVQDPIPPRVNGRESFQIEFQNKLEAYHDVYGAALGVDLDYETNILMLDAATFTTVLSQFDALQVAPDGETTYYNPDTGAVLTGRKLQDDVIDVSLTLMFGGTSGTRFDGTNGTPQLTSDGVGFGDRVVQPFPYLQAPL